MVPSKGLGKGTGRGRHTAAPRWNLIWINTAERNSLHRVPGFKVYLADMPEWATGQMVNEWASDVYPYDQVVDNFWHSAEPRWTVITFSSALQAQNFLHWAAPWSYWDESNFGNATDTQRWMTVHFCRWLTDEEAHARAAALAAAP